MRHNKLNTLILITLLVSFSLYSQTNRKLDLIIDKPTGEVPSTLYGIFFEDINFAADGGLYAELIKNRSFEFDQNLMGWNTFGNVQVRTEDPAFEQNPHYVRLKAPVHSFKSTGIENSGFFGIGLKKNTNYQFSVWARINQPDSLEKIRIELIDSENNPVQSAELIVNSEKWKKYSIIMRSTITESKSKLRIFLISKGMLDLDHVSLFPVDTYKGHENGLRKDLAQALAELKPGVFRFPGGCIVEGTELSDRYNWKNSIGPVENRPTNHNRWEYTFKNRYFPDYYQSYGLGFYEYFQLSEEIGAEPLPIINCGMVCQYINAKEDQLPVIKLDPFIQDALDLIEFANGDSTTHWGKIRTQMGHSKPFNMKFLGVGNEQWGEEYIARLEPFLKVLRKTHPEIQIIGSAGPDPDGKNFEFSWPQMKKNRIDLVDEHYYRNPEWFLTHAGRYDTYDRNGPKVFAGEYACHTASKKNDFESALCESAFLTGIERNADVVKMATYAPLFAHVEGWQWRPDLIWYDNLQLVKTPNYYVQQLFSNFKGTHILKITENAKQIIGQNGTYASAVYDKKTEIYIVKIVNTTTSIQNFNLEFKSNKGTHLRNIITYTLKSIGLDKCNSIENPNQIIPVIENINNNLPVLNIEPQSLMIYTFKL